MTNLDGDVVAALGGDDAVVSIVVYRFVVDGNIVAVVVRVEAVADVVVHFVVPPVSLLVAVRVNSEVEGGCWSCRCCRTNQLCRTARGCSYPCSILGPGTSMVDEVSGFSRR